MAHYAARLVAMLLSLLMSISWFYQSKSWDFLKDMHADWPSGQVVSTFIYKF